MTDKVINEKIAVMLFGLKEGQDFGEWEQHDWIRKSDDIWAPCSHMVDGKEVRYTTEERESLEQQLKEENEKNRLNSEIDNFGYSSNYCNGPACRRCYHSFCEHCTDDYEEALREGPCVIEAPNYIQYYNKVIERIVKENINVDIHDCSDNTFSCGLKHSEYFVIETDENLGRAVCKAAIKFLEKYPLKG